MALETEGLVKRYRRRTVVRGVSISVRPAEVVGLLGPNGAGKTTTFYMVVGLVRPNAGRVFLNGEDITRLPIHQRARRGIGYLAQEPSVFRKLTVEENLLAILELQPLSRSDQRARAEGLLEELQLTNLRHQRADSLSGGERRRVEIARTLATNPSFILLDEPFTGIDPIHVGELQHIVVHLRERGLGILITDHNVRETLSITDRSYIISDGQILTAGTADQLLQDPVARAVYLGEGLHLWFLFSVPPTFQSTLDTGDPGRRLHQEFAGRGITLSSGYRVRALEPGTRWQVLDGSQTYRIVREGETLNVYRL